VNEIIDLIGFISSGFWVGVESENGSVRLRETQA
jgi:hypothetical protein